MAKKEGQERPGPPEATAGIPEKLRYLQANTVQSDGKRWTARAAVEQMNAAGTTISEAYYSDVLRGLKPNPSARMIQALADVYTVNPAYFFTDVDAVTQVVSRVELEVALREAHIKHVANHAEQLSPAQQAAFHRALTQVILQTEPTRAESVDTESAPDESHRH